MSFVQSLKGGGVERALLRLAAGWQAAGRRVTLVIGNTHGPLADELPKGIEVRDLHRGDYGSLVRALPGLVRDMSPDLLFCPGNHYTGAAGYARLRLGGATPPIVGKVSNSLIRPDFGRVMSWGYRRWLHLHRWILDHVVAMTEGMAAEAAREMHISRRRISVIANPLAWPTNHGIATRLPAGRFLVGVGRLEPQKRWDRLIGALPHLGAADVGLLLLGEGGLRPTLEAQVESLGLERRVWMPGHVNDPLPAVARAEALVLTSDFEGVPGVLREALALGTPVITTDSSVAAREIVSSPRFGTVVPRDDPAALIAALDHWLTPGVERPTPTGNNGGDPARDYLDLFDSLVAQRNR
ncbi:MAG: glycosyltransferase [Sphingomonas sp.]